jgi:hypothetical protein
MVAENYRFYQAERTLRSMLENEVAGRLHWAECVDRRRQPSDTQGPWVRAMDHPFLTEIAVHHFDSFRYLFGRRPASVFALSYNVPDSGYDKEAAVNFALKFASDHTTITEQEKKELQTYLTPEQIIELVKLARSEGELVGEQFLHWFLQEQREEVSSMSDLLAIVERGKDNLLLVEEYLARQGGEENPLEAGAPPVAGGAL